MFDLKSHLLTQLASGLKRQASSSQCSRWALNYIVLGKPVPGPFTFDYHPWSLEILDCNQSWIGKKAAQMGYTINALLRALYTIDIKRNDVLYVLPKQNPDATDFSKSKFDPLLELSPHLGSLFNSVKNVGHKQAGTVNLYLRGARSRSGLKSVSTALRVFDERDEMPKWAVALGEERASGYLTEEKQTIILSTPTLPDHGIELDFAESTQEFFTFRCPCCSRYTELTFPECLVITADDVKDALNLKRSYLICKECKGHLPHESKKEWLRHKLLGGTSHFEPLNRTSDIRGFYVNQMYSVVMHPWEIAKMAIQAKTDPASEQELYNSKLGLGRIVNGAKIEISEFVKLMADHQKDDPPQSGLITMGIDVGKKIHYQISKWLIPGDFGPDIAANSTKKVLTYGTVSEFEHLDKFMRDYQVQGCVIDANPSFQSASQFVHRFHGHAYMCYFIKGQKARNISIDKEQLTIGVKRTSWLDLSQGRFKKQPSQGGILLPRDTEPEYKNHIMQPVRIQKREDDGEVMAKYVSKGDDHYAFANCYDEMALHIALSLRTGKDINFHV